jgi:galactokinase
VTTLEAWSVEEGVRRASARFSSAYDEAPAMVTLAPGRVNLIGEHTDYNGGLCLPIALPHATFAAATARDDGRIRLVSGEQRKTWEGSYEDLTAARGWAGYAGGVVWALGEAGHRVDGLDLAVSGCVPLGGGLSSSAALECSVGMAVLALLGQEDSPALRRTLADAGIRAEAEVAGAPTGGMDQTVAVLGTSDHALLLDCRSWATRQVPFEPEAAGLTLLVVDTRVHHSLSDGGYGSRRTECEEAAQTLGVETLREATLDDLDRITDERVRRRARHVVTEIARVSETVAALAAADWTLVGTLMLASHVSMRDDFEISCAELDAVVETATAQGAVGARMTGGGFGGSAIALVPADRVDEVRTAVSAVFADHGWRAPSYLPARASNAARVLRS